MSQTGATPRRRNPRGQGQVLKTQLLEAAAHLLATMDRPETLTLRQVAREVGVAPASIYSHFPDLGSLIQQVLHLRYEELAARMNDAAGTASSPLEELVARCAAYIHWGVEHPGEYRTLFGGGMPETLVPFDTHGVGEEILASVISVLSDVATAPGQKPDPHEDWQAGLLLWTGMHGLVALYNAHGAIDWPPLDDLTAKVLGKHASQPAPVVAKILRTLKEPDSGRPVDPHRS